VWIATGEEMTGFTAEADSWKMRRLRNNPACLLQACNSSGRVRDGSTVFEALAREATPVEAQVLHAAIADKYGFSAKVVAPFVNRIMARLSGRKMGPETAVVISDIEPRH
jgi:PPOX class probable F420-dependent enzyme